MSDDDDIDDDILEVTPERFHRGFIRPSLKGRRVQIADLCTMEELQTAFVENGESGMMRLAQERWEQKCLPR